MTAQQVAKQNLAETRRHNAAMEYLTQDLQSAQKERMKKQSGLEYGQLTVAERNAASQEAQAKAALKNAQTNEDRVFVDTVYRGMEMIGGAVKGLSMFV